MRRLVLLSASAYRLCSVWLVRTWGPGAPLLSTLPASSRPASSADANPPALVLSIDLWRL